MTKPKKPAPEKAPPVEPPPIEPPPGAEPVTEATVEEPSAVFIVRTPLRNSGVEYPMGSRVELSEVEAAELLASGAIVRIDTGRPQATPKPVDRRSHRERLAEAVKAVFLRPYEYQGILYPAGTEVVVLKIDVKGLRARNIIREVIP
ncbi:MAG: hypothetical protein HQL52_03895 [Magnetococcales bacterium]|nr:hypothetical protein [Magnetococcales bacterium]